MGIGIAFRKKAIQSVGGFNQDLQVFEYLELSFRSTWAEGAKTPELTVLHLEPESRFTMLGYMKRRIEYGFWYHALFYLYPRKLSIAAFPVKLLFLASVLTLAIFYRSGLFLLLLFFVYLAWMMIHFRLLDQNSAVALAVSNFSGLYQKLSSLVIAIFVLTAGEIAGDLGKLLGVVKSPIRSRKLRLAEA